MIGFKVLEVQMMKIHGIKEKYFSTNKYNTFNSLIAPNGTETERILMTQMTFSFKYMWRNFFETNLIFSI